MFDGGVRFRNGFEEKSQYIIRTGARYVLIPRVNFTLGMAHLGFYVNDELREIELRPYQEVMLINDYGKVEVAHRIRVEERFFKSVQQGKILDEKNYNFRFRYRFLVNIPIFELSSASPDRRLWLNIGNEILLNGGQQVVTDIFDQNRFLVGVTVSVLDNLEAVATYNHQLGSSPIPDQYKQTYILWIGVKHTMYKK